MRTSFVRLILLIFFGAILLRLLYWQTFRGEELIALAENQHFEDQTIPAFRGSIFFSDNSVLASSQPNFILYGMPKVINQDERSKMTITLAKILWTEKFSKDLKEADEKEEIDKIRLDLNNKLTQDLYWVALAKDIDQGLKKKIEELHFNGLGFEETSKRFYPEGSSSAHLLGFVGSDSKGQSTGYFGLEGFYNGELRGLPGQIKREKDAFGLPILIGNFLSRGERNGKSLRLSIDRTVQYIVEDNLKKGIEKYGAKAASAVVMDPKTGNILALASFPNYDPAKFALFPKEFYKNPIVADHYEPGSTFKVLVMAAAINEDVVEDNTRCDICNGPLALGGFNIKTWNNKYYPDSTMTDVIVHSDNTGMVFVAKKLGLDNFYSYLKKFGFGDLTNIDLQDESAQDLRDKSEWREIDLATASFGQGIAVTPIQMVSAISAIANGGFLMEPHIVSEIRNEDSTFKVKPKIIRRVLNERAAKVVTEMMVKAVEDGESKYLKTKGFKIAGKTGTAQIPVAGHYDPNKTIASFVGFAPADDPKFVMLVRYDQPTSSTFGSETAAPTFFEIAKQLFPYFKIAPVH